MRYPYVYIYRSVYWLNVVSARGITAHVTKCGTEAEIHYENSVLIPLSSGGRVEIKFENIDYQNL